jgi:hypothetical protein
MPNTTDDEKSPEMSQQDPPMPLGVGNIPIPDGLIVIRPEVLVGLPQGRGTPVSTSRTITDESLEYDPESDTVRYATVVTRAGPTDYETVPFEKWAHRRCGTVGMEVLLPTIQERLGKELQGVRGGVRKIRREPLGDLIERAHIVHIGTTYDRDGTVVSEPNVSIGDVLDVVPRTVRTTITLDGREYDHSLPVFVEEDDVHID